MRVVAVMVFLIFTAAIAGPVYAAPATTIDELVAPYNSDKCAECHDDIHKDWAASWHGKSIVDERVLKTFRTFILSGLDKSQGKRRDLKDICLPCHAPATQDASDELTVKISEMIVTAVDDKDEAKRAAATKELSKLDINCKICHNMKATPAGDSPKPNTIYGPGIAKEPPHKDEFGYDTVGSEYLRTSKFCASCHHGCPDGMPSSVCPTLYTSYTEHYMAHGGNKTCQQCHMKAEGKATTHKFPGVYEKDFVKDAIEINISASPTEYVYHLENRTVPAVVMNVKLTSHSGHGMPHG